MELCASAGLIGWVPNTDTLHALIREYRDARKIPLNVEHRLMLGMAPDYENLTVIQKVEVFEHALESTSGMVLTSYGQSLVLQGRSLCSSSFYGQAMHCHIGKFTMTCRTASFSTQPLPSTFKLPDDEQPTDTAHSPQLP